MLSWTTAAALAALASGFAVSLPRDLERPRHLTGVVNMAPMPTTDSFKARATVKLAGKDYDIWRLDALARVGDIATLPFSIRILLENLLRREDGKSVFPEHIEAVAKWDPKAVPSQEIQFTPAR